MPTWRDSFADSWNWAGQVADQLFGPVPSLAGRAIVTVWHFINAVGMAIWNFIVVVWSPVQALLNYIGVKMPGFLGATLQLMVFVFASVAVAGLIGRLFFFRRDRDDPSAENRG